MRLTLNLNDLKESLSSITKFLPASSPKEILKGILVRANEDGRVEWITYNGTLGIRDFLLGEVEEPGSVVLPGNLFYSLVNKLPRGRVELSMEPGESAITLKSGGHFSQISVMKASEFPELPVLNHVNWSVSLPQAKLREMLDRVSFARAAADETRPLLTGVNLLVNSTHVRITALDGFKMATQVFAQKNKLPAGEEEISVVLSGEMVKNLATILEDTDVPCLLSFDENHMLVTFGNVSLIASTLAGQYIYYAKVIPPEFASRSRVNTNLLKESVSRCLVVARENSSKLMKIAVLPDEMEISANASQIKMKDQVPHLLSGGDLTIAFNCEYFTEILNHVSADEVTLHFNGPTNPLMITPVDSEDYLFILLPVRVAE